MLPFSPDELRDFIQKNEHTRPADIILRVKAEDREKTKSLIEQMDARKRLADKVPEWAARFDLFLPPSSNLAQASNTETAEYKAQDVIGRLLDLTAGSGIDGWKMGGKADTFTAVDPNSELARRTSYNLQTLGIPHEFHICTAEEFVASCTEKYDWIYLDPSRKTEGGSKAVALHRMLPDVPSIWKQIHEIATHVKMKLSPLFDLRVIELELPYVYKIEVLAKKGEVKEIVTTSSKTNSTDLSITAAELAHGREWSYTAKRSELGEKSEQAKSWEKYLYDPSAALNKAGLSDHYAYKHGLCRVMNNVPLYTHSELLPAYPGRIFEIIETGKPFKLKNLPKRLSIVTRNYFDKPEMIRKRLKAGESDDDFLFAVSENRKNAVFIYATKVV
ncbi:MAG: class I SAM-dependent methyltransferase [Bacteroidetes bacterium]|nr:MAG: class I SAM-dependent methyltransferase [Bacteroidota bacterium]